MTGNKRSRVGVWLALLALVGVGACSDGSPEGDADKADVTEDTSGPVFQPNDVAVNGDASGGKKDTSDAPKDAAISGDSSTESKAFGDVCTTNDECDSKRCVFTAGGLRCSKACTDDCGDDDWACRKVGTDSICVWRWGHVCEPCAANKDCFSNGQNTAKCVDLGADGAFCGVTCASDTQCPSGYKCKNVKDVEGADIQQCLPSEGPCNCSAWSVDNGLATTCQKSNNFGSCGGKAKCTSSNEPPACDAPKPATEACDLVDNNCDGVTDEGTCDDGKDCTTDTCDGTKGCKVVNKISACDADGSECTSGDACKDGDCTAGEVLVCDDKNPCTQDTCDAAKGCVFANVAAPCDADDNPCTVADACAEGKCVAGAAKPCESGQACVTGACSIATGKCKFTDKDGHSCTDGDACATGGKCVGETCKSSPLDCDDSKPCTTDSCDKATGCKHTDAEGTCDDGDACTKDDACEKGGCTGLPVAATVDCDDNNPCTTEGCDSKIAAKIGCTYAPVVGACDDNNACTAKDTCQAGKCVSGTNECKCKANSDCDNNSPCTDDTCVTEAGVQVCKSTPIEKLACDADGSVCTEDDLCANGKCTAGATKSCDDANACTLDSCEPKSGCKNAAKSGSCDDSNPCTAGDACAVGQDGKVACVAGTTKDCDDKVACTVDSCDPKSGGCKNESAVGKNVECYSADAKFVGVGPCKKGNQTCKADGTLTACQGEVVPAKLDVCGNGVDDDCNGVKDQGCAPIGFDGRFAAGAVSGKSGQLQVSGVAGATLSVGAHKSGKWTLGLGLYEWLSSL